MIITVLVLGAVAVGIGVSFEVVRRDRRAHADFIVRTRTDWTRAGRIIHYGPVAAYGYGSRPQKTYSETSRAFGALALVDGKLIFTGYRLKISDVQLPVALLKWVGIRQIKVSDSEGTALKTALVIHTDGPGGWHVYVWVIPHNLDGFARELSRQAELPIQHYGSKHEDFGPSSVTRMTQDIYGVWSKDRGGDLYLAPGCLIFGWRQQIALDAIRTVNVLTKGGWSDLNPFASELLQLDYVDQTGKLQTTAFLIRQGEKWAQSIQDHTGAAVEHFAGRKKKQEK